MDLSKSRLLALLLRIRMKKEGRRPDAVRAFYGNRE
jgi:hypothetical protein